ncbi:MAG: dolichyl-diphosphooligosaccharide--protein glycosyltransferase subunit STT3 [Methanobacteriaceae archaeon]
MSKKSLISTLIAICLILTIAIFFRLESINLNGIPENEKAFYQDENGLPYMYEGDSYYNYRLTRNFLDHGYMGDEIVNGIEWDLHSYYPPGVPMDYSPLIVYLTSFFYKIINFFAYTPLLVVSFWMSLFVGPFAGVAIYFFVKRFSNDVAGLIAGILAVIAPIYLLRTVPGWFDTDMFNLTFPILIAWFFMEAVHNDNFKIKTVFTILSSFSIFIFAIAWNGWQYIFYLIAGYTLIYIVWAKFKGEKVKNCFKVFLIFLSSSFILIFTFSGFITILKPIYGLIDINKLIGVGNLWSPWPDLYVAVSELQVPSVNEIISDLGLMLLALGLLGIILIFRFMINKQLKTIYLKDVSKFFYIFLIAWLLIGFLSLLKGARFIILLIPPLAISSGISVSILLKYLENFIKNKKLIRPLTLILIFILITPQFLVAQDSLNLLKPAVNDDLWDSAQWIKANTTIDTVIITDWSYGHFYSVIAERPVSFDGRSAYIETLPIRKFYGDNLTFNGKIPNTSREYWISHAFSTTNKTLSAGIFRMLANSGDYAYLTLDKYTENTTRSVEILNNILGVNKTSAQEILIRDGFNEKQVSEILDYTHPQKEKPFVVLTNDRMVNTGRWDLYFGEWDFNKETGGNYTYNVGVSSLNGQVINSTNNVTINIENGKITWKNREPYCFIRIKDNYVDKRYINPNSEFCVILLDDIDNTVVIDKKFENSLLTKLIFEKINTKCFESLYKNKKVVVWNVTFC